MSLHGDVYTGIVLVCGSSGGVTTFHRTLKLCFLKEATNVCMYGISCEGAWVREVGLCDG